MDFKRVLASAPRKHEKGEPHLLKTSWGEAVSASASGVPLGQHPRPQCARDAIVMLNGAWGYCFEACENAGEQWRAASIPQDFDGQIQVPFSPEATLSGVGRQLQPDELLWYRRRLRVPAVKGRGACLLHFDAVDYACACYVNGVRVGEHEGAYLPFQFDITDALAAGASEAEDEGLVSVEIALCVYDPSDKGSQLRGKQRLEAGDIWYTAQSGIWQSVWLEYVPEKHVSKLDITATGEGFLSVMLDLTGLGERLSVELLDAEGGLVSSETLEVPENESFETTVRTVFMMIPDVRAWSPGDPYLYGLVVRYGEDELRSYCGFRTLSMEKDERGVKRFCLNGKPVFLRGVLDQGYWPEGLLTAPSDEALVWDIQTMKDLGFNMLRKHIKVECERWYYHCDRLGMLVWQDMPSGGGAYEAWHTSYKPTLFRRSWHAYDDSQPRHYAHLSAGDPAYREQWGKTCLGTVEKLGNHPSIVTWVLFNEAWGQFEARKMTKLVRAVDASRPVDSVSGWYDQSCGDFLSVHNYFRELEVYRDHAKPEDARDVFNADGSRAFAISEFGGLAFLVPGHSLYDLSYGYASFETIEEWREGVRAQLAQADALEAKGLAGFVYTQLSDVEEEVNGLVTYDRRVVKLAPGASLGLAREDNCADEGNER